MLRYAALASALLLLTACASINNALSAYVSVNDLGGNRYQLKATGQPNSADYEVQGSFNSKAKSVCGDKKAIISNKSVSRQSGTDLGKVIDRNNYGSWQSSYYVITGTVQCQ